MVAPKESLRSQKSRWQEGFLALLPAIKRYVRFAFRRLPYGERCDAVQEAIANALVAYRRLVQLGRQSLAYATPLAQFAVKQVREGRQIATRRNVHDVLSPYCQRRKRVQVQSLTARDQRTGRWQELLIEDRRSTPADIAALKLDFNAWLHSLAPLKRAITESLASGESPQQVAILFHVSKARISQLRRELRTRWDQFQGEISIPLGGAGSELRQISRIVSALTQPFLEEKSRAAQTERQTFSQARLAERGQCPRTVS